MNKRIAWIDMAKGWGMLLIILGHMGLTLLPDMLYVQAWIYTFHIPLFFFLSGYLFSVGDSLRSFTLKKLRTIVLPYFLFGVVILLFETYTAVKQYRFSTDWLFETVKRFLIQDRFWTIWFLGAILVMNVMMYVMVRLLKKPWLIAAAAAVAGVLAMVYYTLGGSKLPWDTDVAFAAMPYFCGGYIMKLYSGKVDSLFSGKLRPALIFLLCVAVHLGAGWLNFRHLHTTVDMFSMRYGIVPLAYLSAFGGIFAAVIFSRWLTLRPVSFIGENSIFFLAWHQTIVIPVVKELLSDLHFTVAAGDPADKIVLYWGVELGLVLIIMTAVIKLINNTKLRRLFGRKR